MYENFKVPSNVSIAGYVWDCENAEQVVCIVHGIGEYMARYDRMAAVFNNAKIAVMGMDHRGHGLSAGKRGHTAPRKDVLEDVDSLIRCAQERYPGVPIVLYGHSMGGNITLDYRIRGNMSDAASAYIISAPWIKLYKPYPKPVVTLANFLAKVKPDFQISSSIDESILGYPESVGPYKADPLVHSKVTALCAVDGFTIGDMLYDNTLEGNKGGIDKPFLLMHGDEDMICHVDGSRMVAKHNPDCQYIEWPGYYHEIHNGGAIANGDAVIEAAKNFIKEIK